MAEVDDGWGRAWRYSAEQAACVMEQPRIEDCSGIAMEASIWRRRRSEELAAILPFLNAHTERRTRNESHPVYDFLFQYYRFRASQLRRWSPGCGVVLEDSSGDQDLPAQFCAPRGRETARWLDPGDFPWKRQPALQWTIQLLQETRDRPPVFGCDGMHEWAMVYRAQGNRHPEFPLRVTADRVAEIVESRGLICTHFDAFRFFTEAAKPLNRMKLNRELRHSHEQRGCLHTNMDLYKWAYKWVPWVPSCLLFTALEIAIRARELDMRASPYDLRSLGFSPIRIEEPSGREEYRRLQREIADDAQPIRERLVEELSHLTLTTR